MAEELTPFLPVRSATRTFEGAPYSYGPLIVGLVLLSFGVGNIIGSVGGGRYSDYIFNGMKAANGGVGEPEVGPVSKSLHSEHTDESVFLFIVR